MADEKITVTDEEIIAMLFRRDQSALFALSENYGGLLYCIALRITGKPSDAEECVNDTYLALWRQIPPQQPRSLKAYAGALCRNIALDKFKRGAAAKRGGGKTEILLSEIEEFIPSRAEIGEEGGDDEIAEVIDKFLAKLKKEERVIFVRRYWYADDVKEIASRMNFSESKVKSMLFRLRGRLKKVLMEEGIGL